MLWHHFAIRLGLALILGALIGAERQWRQRMAGLRTRRSHARDGECRRFRPLEINPWICQEDLETIQAILIV